MDDQLSWLNCLSCFLFLRCMDRSTDSTSKVQSTVKSISPGVSLLASAVVFMLTPAHQLIRTNSQTETFRIPTMDVFDTLKLFFAGISNFESGEPCIL